MTAEAPIPRPALTVYLYGLLGLAILNGVFSPLTFLVFLLRGLWYPFFLPNSVAFVFLFSSLITSTFLLMIAGVPAALYERFSGKNRTDLVSLWIWVSALAILTLPALPNVLRALGRG
jgi:hypothetical protein